MDYVSFQANEYAYVAAVEKLLGIEVPEKAVVDAHAACSS